MNAIDRAWRPGDRTGRPRDGAGSYLKDACLWSVGTCALLAGWQVASWLGDPRLLPPPAVVVASFLRHLLHGDMLYHFSVTLMRVAASFVIAMIVGCAIGVFMGLSRRTDRLLDPLLILGLNIPALVVTVLCYVWFGLVEAAAVTAVAVNKIPTVVVLVREGTRALQPEAHDVARAFRLSFPKRLAQVYLPQLYPAIMSAARAGLALIWKIVLVVELLGRSNGVGFQLSIFFQFFDVASILAYTLAFVALMMVIEGLLLRRLERRLTGWRL